MRLPIGLYVSSPVCPLTLSYNGQPLVSECNTSCEWYTMSWVSPPPCDYNLNRDLKITIGYKVVVKLESVLCDVTPPAVGSAC